MGQAPLESTVSDRSSSHGCRIRLIDAVRGFSVVSMVLFHLCYDLVFIAGVSVPWFVPPLRDIWRASISWTFLAVAGVICSLSRNNLRRSWRYLLLAAAIYVATTLAAVDTPISFGIIFCMGATTLLYALLERVGLEPRGIACALVLLACFLLCLGVPHGYVGLGQLRLMLPRAPYDTDLLSWLGFIGPHFSSGDYYPLLPYSLAYLAGAAFARSEVGRKLLDGCRDVGCAPLEAVGRHPLAIYVAHQPIILALVLALT